MNGSKTDLELERTTNFHPWLNSASFWYPNFLARSAWIEHAPFAFWIVNALKPRSLVELGTHRGFSYFAFCQAVEKLGLETRCYAVDTWKGDEHAGFYGEEVFERVREYNTAHYTAFSSLVRSTFDEALPHYADGSIDLLHIDGRHFYEDVKHDFESWRPKLSDRAVVLFHDTNERARDFGVFRLWEELAREFPSFEFLHGHGLGVLGYGSSLPAEVKAFFETAADPATAAELRMAYGRLGAALQRDFESRHVRTQLDAKLKKHEMRMIKLTASLEVREEEVRKLQAELRKQVSYTAEASTSLAKEKARAADLSAKLEMQERELQRLKNTNRSRITILQDMRSGLRSLERRIRPLTKALRRKNEVSQEPYVFKHSLEDSISRAEAAVKTKDWSNAVVRWQSVLNDIAEQGVTGSIGRSETNSARSLAIDALVQRAKSNISIAQRICDVDSYKERIAEYARIRAAKRLEQSKDKKIVIYTAISRSYDSVKLPAELDARFDYVLFTDAAVEDTGIYQVRPILYFHEDATRSARFIKIHPHVLLKDYDVAIWVDANVMIFEDIYPLVQQFLASGKAFAAVPHPLRSSVYEELDACIERRKDDPEIMREQIASYKEAMLDGRELIESNLMIFDLHARGLDSFLNTWWAQLDRYSRRDQLSLPYAISKTGVAWHRLTERPNSVRNHSAFALVPHDAGEGPASDLLKALQAPVIDPYDGRPYSEIRDQRISMQKDRRIDVIVCVHNALEHVKLCLESVRRTRTSDNQRLIIIDDGSDQATAQYLQSFAGKATWIELHRNDHARGYTKAANQGLSAATGEFIVLLNSDTIVTDDWAEKMADAVFSTPGAGIVGPLSNAASYQSIPECDGTKENTAINDMPPGISPADMNRFCENWTTAHMLPSVPVVHGFCFGLTRVVIDHIGLFDEDKFPQGYGEENDYCFRAADAGFALVVATHTYVFHVKSASYPDARRMELVKLGSENFRRLHGYKRVRRAVKSMQENPFLVKIRERARSVYKTSKQDLLAKQIEIDVGEGLRWGQVPQPYVKTHPFSGLYINDVHRSLAQAPLQPDGVKIIHPIPGSLRREDAAKIYELAYFADGPIADIGTNCGLSAAIAAQALSDAGTPFLVYTVDVDSKMCERAVAAFQLNNITNVVAHEGEAAEWLDVQRQAGRLFAFVFVDHSHAYDHVKAVCERLGALVRPGAFVAFHDFIDRRNADSSRSDFAVAKAVIDGLDHRFHYEGASGCTGLFRFMP